MEYISTRGGIEPISFKDTVMMGLADDGGLILSSSIPRVDEGAWRRWAELSYRELATEVISIYADDIPRRGLEELIARSYSSFDHPDVAPLARVGRWWIMELFHGPTLAFKDVALQLLGNLFQELLEERRGFMNILGATSGDTGSAAIYGVKGKERITIFILHPHNRVSPVQALQMTTVPDANVFNIAVEGTFDDCQAIVKAIFNDLPFKQEMRLGSVNSINWARLVAQVVYYIHSALWLWRHHGAERVHFSVPTGNFGDIFAGYIAKRMMSPLIDHLILATNENRVLTRFLVEGRYAKGEVVPTISPSMDIMVASNFERYLYYLYGEDPQRVREAMERFNDTGEITFEKEEIARAREDFASASVDQEETIAVIRDVYHMTGHEYVVDPHTAVGIGAVQRLRSQLPPGEVVCLATAHPAKFPAAVRRAIGRDPQRPASLNGLEERERRFVVMPPDVDAIKGYIAEKGLKGA